MKLSENYAYNMMKIFDFKNNQTEFSPHTFHSTLFSSKIVNFYIDFVLINYIVI